MTVNSIKLNIYFGLNQQFDLKLVPTSSVLEVKQKCEEYTKVAINNQKLLFKGNILNDNDKLCDFKIQDNTRLYMVKAISSMNFDLESCEMVLENDSENLKFQEQQSQFQKSDLDSIGSGNCQNFELYQILNNPQLANMALQMISNPPLLQDLISQNQQAKEFIAKFPQLQAAMNDPQMLSVALQMIAEKTRNQQPFGGNQFFQNQQQVSNQSSDLHSIGFNSEGGMQGSPQMQQPEQQYQIELVKLQEMGFPNPEANLEALIYAQGNLQTAVERLIS